MAWQLKTDELGRISRHLPGGNEENHDEPQSVQLIFGHKSKPGSSRI
jgi:hypothetical protein